MKSSRTLLLFLIVLLSSLSVHALQHVLVNETVLIPAQGLQIYELMPIGELSYDIVDLTGSKLNVYVTQRTWLLGSTVGHYYGELSTLSTADARLARRKYDLGDYPVLVVMNNNLISATRVTIVFENDQLHQPVESGISTIYIILAVFSGLSFVAVTITAGLYVYNFLKTRHERIPLINNLKEPERI